LCHSGACQPGSVFGDDPGREVWPASAAEPSDQSERYGGEGHGLSTLADQAAALRPLHALIETSVLSGRIEQLEDPCQSQDTLRSPSRSDADQENNHL